MVYTLLVQMYNIQGWAWPVINKNLSDLVYLVTFVTCNSYVRNYQVTSNIIMHLTNNNFYCNFK